VDEKTGCWVGHLDFREQMALAVSQPVFNCDRLVVSLAFLRKTTTCMGLKFLCSNVRKDTLITFLRA